ncbi:MAG: hypothetical protein HZB50_10680 [Chloroflexi bacterium]|nr:hypothetical protein [Chloroflexota bacterium]
MNNSRTPNRDYSTIAWGLLLIWWGLRGWLFASLPNGVGLLGTGVILLGLNAVRLLSGIPARGSTTTLGILTFVFGGFLMVNETLNLSLQLPIFEILLITLGVFLVTRAIKKTETKIECCA